MPVNHGVVNKLPINIACGGSAAGWAKEELDLELAPAFGGDQGRSMEEWAAEQNRVCALTCETYASELAELQAEGYRRPELSLQLFAYAHQEAGLRMRPDSTRTGVLLSLSRLMSSSYYGCCCGVSVL